MPSELRFALLGDPVAHSRSPQIHSKALALAGLKGRYTAIKADAAVLAQAIGQLRTGDWDGLNITMPLKRAAWELSERTTPLARQATSVNTLRFRDGAVEGHSTDAEAFGSLLVRDGFQMGDVLILGAGGAARAALASITTRSVFVSSRDERRAGALCRGFSNRKAIKWGRPVPEAVVINATPLGMKGEGLPEGVLESAAGLIDLPYGESATTAVLAAQAAGVPFVDGLEFLTLQAAAAFQRWTGIGVDFDTLIETARNV